RVFMDLNLQKTKEQLLLLKPDVVFNLFEGIKEHPDLIYLGAGLLESMKIPYTGCTLESIFISSNKVLTKQILCKNSILTPKWFTPQQLSKASVQTTYIIKPTSEDASIGITEKSVIQLPANEIIADYKIKYKNNFFIEEYIDGREFNISIVSTPNGPKVLTPAEMVFSNFPENKRKILGYDAKWDETTFEYKNTKRIFDVQEKDIELLRKIEEITLKCWQVFNLKGYARVDYRIDADNNSYVLEINANPCIAADSGFYAAALKSNFTFTQIVENLLIDALNI
ncbi:MAG: ATP-grasp domain-containing protein, partial [Bacteroidales bacterium]|nr:ATP-grasp domain-containing protein [Bacteroidales bacterium]